MFQSLSPAEYRVFQAFREGLSDEEIAEKLGLSPKTVKFQMQQVYRKFELIGGEHKSRKLFALILKEGR